MAHGNTQPQKMNKKALVIGATGLVGSNLVRLLIEDPVFGEINVFGRRSLGIEDVKLKEHIVDFDQPDSWKSQLKGDVLFSSLGTTIKKAGSKNKQYKVDYTYQHEAAQAANENKVETCVLVSSLGANPSSRIFYSRIKGELDEAVQQMGFNSVFILRPSALIGERSEKRAGESVMIMVTNFSCKIFPFLKKYQPIPAQTVAAAMINLAKQNKLTNNHVIDNPEIFLAAEGNASKD